MVTLFFCFSITFPSLFEHLRGFYSSSQIFVISSNIFLGLKKSEGSGSVEALFFYASIIALSIFINCMESALMIAFVRLPKKIDVLLQTPLKKEMTLTSFFSFKVCYSLPIKSSSSSQSFSNWCSFCIISLSYTTSKILSFNWQSSSLSFPSKFKFLSTSQTTPFTIRSISKTALSMKSLMANLVFYAIILLIFIPLTNSRLFIAVNILFLNSQGNFCPNSDRLGAGNIKYCSLASRYLKNCRFYVEKLGRFSVQSSFSNYSLISSLENYGLQRFMINSKLDFMFSRSPKDSLSLFIRAGKRWDLAYVKYDSSITRTTFARSYKSNNLCRQKEFAISHY